jgi:hypothetical protein
VTSRSNDSASSRARRLARRAARILALILVVGVPAGAAEAARKKVVLLDFKGPKARRVQRGVVKLLKPATTVMNSKAYVRAARQVADYAPDAAGVSKVARRLKAHGVVTGKVSKKGRKWSLTLQILEGRSGEMVGDGITVGLKRGRLSKAAKAKIKRELRAVIKDLPDPNAPAEEAPDGDLVASASDGGDEAAGEAGAAAGATEAAGETTEQPPEEAETPERTELPEARPARPRRVASAEMRAGGEDVASEPDASLSAEASAEADREARGRGVDVVAGVSFVSRKLTFDFVDGLANQPQGYDGGLVPGVFAAAELYPMALLDSSGSSFLRDIGLSLVFDRVLLIKSELEGGDGESLPTAQTRYGGGLVYRWNFGSSPTNPTLKVGARFNQQSFTIDEGEAADPGSIEIPDVKYTYIDPGIGLRLPLGLRIAILAEARYLYVLDAGQIQNDNRYGSASVIAFDADVGGEFKVLPYLVARAGARYASYSLEFDGTGELTERTDDGMQDVTAAKDRYLGFYATAGLLF